MKQHRIEARPTCRLSLFLGAGLIAVLMVTLAVPASAAAGYGFVTKWGSEGSGNGQFSTPRGLGTDPAGNVYVVEDFADRLQKFSSDGAFLTKWGTPGPGNGQFNLPQDVATDSAGNVYVADGLNNRVQKFNSSGAFLLSWGSSGIGDGQFSLVTGVATDASGNVYVADNLNDRVQKFSSSGAFLTKWGTSGSGNGQFDGPAGVAADASGNVYVMDRGNDRVQKFNAAGGFLTKWGTQGAGHGQFFQAHHVTTDAAGNVYVGDSDGFRVQKFDAAGAFLAQIGSLGTGDGQFEDTGTGGVAGVAIDAVGDIYVGDLGANRIQKFHELIEKISLKAAQKAKKLKLKASCPKEICTLKITGKATVIPNGPGPKRNRAGTAAKAKKFKLQKKSVDFEAGKEKNVRLKFKGKSLRKITRLIKRGAKAKATIKVRSTAPSRDLEPMKLKVKKLKV